MQKLEIEYPCPWSYRIIGSDEKMLRKAAAAATEDKEYTLTLTNRSSGGKYHALRLEIIVVDEPERLRIFKNLKEDDAIKFVL